MKSRLNGAFIWTVILGLFVLLLVTTARGFPDLLQVTPYIAGYGTLAMIAILIIGNFYPGILRWTETTLQDLWGGGGTADDAAELKDQAPEREPSWSDIVRAIGFVVGFLAFVFVLGFPVVTPVYVTLYLVLEARVRFIWAAMVGVFVTVTTETTLQDLWGGGGTADDAAELKDQAPEREPSWSDIVRAIGFVVGFLAFVFVLGFPVVTPVYVTLYLVLEARVRFIWAAMVGVFVTVLIVTGMVLLQVEVWAGIGPEIIADFVGGAILPPI